jgi:SPP1 family predicted phage head-tail adaptor
MSLQSLMQTKGKSIRVKRPHSRDDSMGSRIQTFVNRASVRGYVSFNGSSEIYEGNRKVIQDQIQVYVRGGTDVEVTDRIELDNRTYEVTGKRTPGHRQAGDRLHYHILDAVSNESV